MVYNCYGISDLYKFNPCDGIGGVEAVQTKNTIKIEPYKTTLKWFVNHKKINWSAGKERSILPSSLY